MTDWLILAGGSGSRLGQDKAATPIDGRPLLDRARATIDSVTEEATIHVLDQAYPGGPAAAVVAGLARCESEHVGVLAVDMPFAADALVHVLSAVAGQPAASPRHLPAEIVAVPSVPRTVTGKLAELAVTDIANGDPVRNTRGLIDPSALEAFQVWVDDETSPTAG